MDDHDGGEFPMSVSSSAGSGPIYRVDYYDFAGRLTRTINGGVRTGTDHDCRNDVSDPAAGPASSKPRAVMLRLLTRTFEFRLSGSEEKRLAIDLGRVRERDCVLVTTDRVRAFVTGSEESAAPSAVIGGIEVWTEKGPRTSERSETFVCVAQATDFGANDLIVVQVDVTVHCVGCTD
jgi:hypothetical protein